MTPRRRRGGEFQRRAKYRGNLGTIIAEPQRKQHLARFEVDRVSLHY
jgi:hypothetical protein